MRNAGAVARVSPATRAELAMERQGIAEFDVLRKLGIGDDPSVMVGYAAGSGGLGLRLSEALREIDAAERRQNTVVGQDTVCRLRARP